MWKKKLMKNLFSTNPAHIDVAQALNLKYKHMPVSLYKYKSFDRNEHWIKMLKEDLIVLVNPRYFNDPYDCAFSFPAEENGIKHFKQNIDRILSQLSPIHTFSLEEKDKLIKSKNFFYDLMLILQEDIPFFKDKSAEEASKKLEEIFKKELGHSNLLFEEKIRDNMFIACFSETNKSILMWSHYADNHRGFCVEYNFPELGVDNHLTGMLFPVIYENKLFDTSAYLNPDYDEPKFNNVLISYCNQLNNPLFDFTSIENPIDKNYNNMVFCYAAINKSQEWNYEKEWRYILPLGNEMDKKIDFRLPKPKAVYLGTMVSEENKNKVLEIVEKRNIEVYSMSRKPSEFGLEHKNLG